MNAASRGHLRLSVICFPWNGAAGRFYRYGGVRKVGKWKFSGIATHEHRWSRRHLSATAPVHGYATEKADARTDIFAVGAGALW